VYFEKLRVAPLATADVPGPTQEMLLAPEAVMVIVFALLSTVISLIRGTLAYLSTPNPQIR
jgi:hypothetical protein